MQRNNGDSVIPKMCIAPLGVLVVVEMLGTIFGFTLVWTLSC